MWKLFIDDERNIEDVYWAPEAVKQQYKKDAWAVARTLNQVMSSVHEFECMPSFISFDHDLGENTFSGFAIAKALVELCLDGKYALPDDFDYYVHSKNPVGKANIEGYLNGYLAAIQRSKETNRFDELYDIMLADDDSGSILVGKNE